MLDPKSLLDFICDDILPSYEIDPSVGRNDPELADAVRTYLAAARPAVTVKPFAAKTADFLDSDDPWTIRTNVGTVRRARALLARHADKDKP